jgi:hypothetical protein
VPRQRSPLRRELAALAFLYVVLALLPLAIGFIFGKAKRRRRHN